MTAAFHHPHLCQLSRHPPAAVRRHPRDLHRARHERLARGGGRPPRQRGHRVPARPPPARRDRPRLPAAPRRPVAACRTGFPRGSLRSRSPVALRWSPSRCGGGCAARTAPASKRLAVTGLVGWQAAVLIAAYGLWQYTGSKALYGTVDGIDRGRRLWDFERDLHIPNEASFQRLFLPHHTFVKFLNLYYVGAHYNVLLLMLAWLLWRHRDRYNEARNVILLATFACLAVQLIPVAPPRLIPGHVVVDTPVLYGQSVYGPIGQGFSDQYSAMPSVHIAWSSAVAFFIWRSTKSRWRYIGVVHALLTWTVVVATGNHYWADGIVAIAILALSFWTVRLGSYLWRPGVTVAGVETRRPRGRQPRLPRSRSRQRRPRRRMQRDGHSHDSSDKQPEPRRRHPAADRAAARRRIAPPPPARRCSSRSKTHLRLARRRARQGRRRLRGHRRRRASLASPRSSRASIRATSGRCVRYGHRIPTSQRPCTGSPRIRAG